MGRQAGVLLLGVFLLAILASGCGLIGGPFDEPSPEELGTPNPAGDNPINPLPGDATPVDTPVYLSVLPADCVDAAEITAEDVGRTICVGGRAYLAWQEHGTYYVDFDPEKKTFYMIGYDWESVFIVRPGDCVYAKGKVVLLNEVPALGIDPYTLKQCPTQVAPATD